MILKKIMAIGAVLTVLAICSCAASREHNGVSPEFALEKASSQADEQKPDKLETEDRKILKQGEIRFETADVNKTKSLISQTVQDMNGYIAKDNAYDYDKRLEHRLIIRIPADKFDLLLKNISENVDRLDGKSIDILDVTEEYIDIEA
ncbi:MAG: DUF4349 domain-containing protein, partial [Syntrophobacterales bacterium]|nr:DUF4349 domain-containing protein [Syntrophobacterales bacterium]